MSGAAGGEQLQLRVNEMIDMLNEGKMLDVLVTFYAPEARVYENDNVFAEGRAEAYARQQPFVDDCSDISGDVRLVYRDLGRGIAVCENHTRYTHPTYGPGQIEGVHVFYWQEGLITREEYFTGDKARETLNFWQQVRRTQE